MAKRGRPSNKELARRKEEKEKDLIIKGVCIFGLLLLLGIFTMNVRADEIVHQFKNPSFSGIGTSSHYLTIENQEFNRKADIIAEIKALKEQQERDAENTTLARFIKNLESRIYAQLSRQLVDQLFGETPSDSGVLEFMGTTIEYTVSADGLMITLKITDADGNVTEITLPIGSFTF
jgi:hypothetical protein